MNETLYEILGVARDVDADTLRSSYRELARELHPDLRPDDPVAEERFKQVSRAYDVLSDPEQRALYDEFGEAALSAGFDAESARRARDAFGGGFRAGGSDAYGDLEEMLGSFFSGFAPRDQAPRRGVDLETSLRLDFVTAARGGSTVLWIDRPMADGSSKREKLTVRIPAGVSHGGRIRLAGKGGEAPGWPAGDLYLRVLVSAHPVFRREGSDLHLELPVHFREAALGAVVELPTLDGRAQVSVPPGTQGGARLRLRGKGVPAQGGRAAGDLIATVRIAVPRALDPDQQAAVEALASSESADLRESLFAAESGG